MILTSSRLAAQMISGCAQLLDSGICPLQHSSLLLGYINKQDRETGDDGDKDPSLELSDHVREEVVSRFPGPRS